MSSSSYHWTDNLLMDPYDEPKWKRKEAARLFEEEERKSYISCAQKGIPKRCPCGGSMKEEVSPTPKYKKDYDTQPGMLYFTCENYKDDGFHFRQPWVRGVEQEIGKLSRQVENQNKTIEEQKKMIEEMRKEIDNLTQEVSTIQQYI